MAAYPHLFASLSLGSLQLPNRVFVAPMATNLADTQHCVTDQLVEYWVARARGGFGLLITEHAAVHRTGLTSPRMLGVFDDAHIPGLQRLAQAVHQVGGLIAVQLQHGGRQASEECIGGVCFSPSAIPSGRDRRTPRELDDDRIWEIVTAFGDAAARCQEAGMDGVEIHMAHGYLGCSFLSPLLNQRDDIWGGDTERRTRFAREVMQAIRTACGPDFTVWCRVSADEFLEGGMTLDEMKRVVPLLERHGYQAIHVSAAIGETAYYASAPYYVEQGHLLPLSEGVKQVTDLPVIGVGNLHDPEVLERALADGLCDAVALGRQALADADWPRKARSGQVRSIIPCTYCGLGCGERSFSGGSVRCTNNPWTGLESAWPDWPDGPPAAVPKRVLVVGGGPAGMQCAVTAACRGHHVQLWERDDRLGGAYYTASLPPGKRIYQSLIAWYERELERLGVQMRLGTEATPEGIAEAAPEVLVLAPGARSRTLAEAGISGEATWAAADVLRLRPDLSEPVAVIGGDVSGAETAHFLAELGYDVVLLEKEAEIARGVTPAARHFLLAALEELGVVVHTLTTVTAVEPGLVRAGLQEFACGSVVSALGRVPGVVLPQQPRDCEVHVIGDAARPWHAQAAIYAGAELGRAI
ncbi:MAG: FAD-dependent oxidoreductase [Armatimonadetes bacterium]|nr:FAD-dependent oxidoreductase [Armatimonadota bacterium]